MKFRKYINEATVVTEEVTPIIVEDVHNPDAPSYVRDELDRLYNPVKKLIADGKFDEAKVELDVLEQELNEFEAANAKKKLFRFPQVLINGQRDTLAALRAQIPQNESIEDMDRRCEKCNTLLNDGGTCPKCDDGAEDTDEPDEIIEEELSNKEKLKRAFPELNFDKEVVMEAVGADTLDALKDGLQKLGDNDVAAKIVDILNLVPASFADELFASIKSKLGHVKLNNEQRSAIVDAAEGVIPETDEETVAGILASSDNSEQAKMSPEKLKGLVTTVLAIIALIEPTPVLEIVTAVVAAMPNEVVEQIMNMFTSKTEGVEDSVVVEELSNKEKLKRAFPELNFDNPAVVEDIDSEDVTDYDDDYYDLDDVEQDRAHAALYGGDRMYCDCGAKLAMDEFGSYCPVCDAEEVELNRQAKEYSEDELRDMDAFDNLDDDI